MQRFAPGEKGVVILLMEGGHKTRIQGLRPSEVAGTIEDARRNERGLVFIQNTQYGENNLAIDPAKVVGLVGADL